MTVKNWKNKYEGSFIEINGPHGIKSIVEESFKVVKKTHGFDIKAFIN